MPARNIDYKQIAESLSDDEIISLLLMSDEGKDAIEIVSKGDQEVDKNKYPIDPVKYSKDILGIEVDLKV